MADRESLIVQEAGRKGKKPKGARRWYDTVSPTVWLLIILGCCLVTVGILVWLGVLTSILQDRKEEIQRLQSAQCSNAGDHVLFQRDFTAYEDNITEALFSNFSYFAVPNASRGFKADDGNATVDAVSGLVVDGGAFQTRDSDVFEHPKWLVLNTVPVTAPVGAQDSFYYEAFLACYTTGIYDGTGATLPEELYKYVDGNRGITDAAHDPRIASCAMNLVDVEAFMIYDFIIINNTIYVLYEKLPFGNQTGHWTYAKAVATRVGNVTEPVRLRMSYNRHARRISYYVNGELAASVAPTGLRPAGDGWVMVNNAGGPTDAVVESRVFLFGFGRFSLLDFMPFDTTPNSNSSYGLAAIPKTDPNAKLYQREPLAPEGLVYPELNYVYNSTQEVDGQGAVLIVRNVTMGTTRQCA